MTTGLVYTRALPCQAGAASWNRRNASHHLYGFRCTEGDAQEAGFVLLIVFSSKIVGLPVSGTHVATVLKRLFGAMRHWIET